MVSPSSEPVSSPAVAPSSGAAAKAPLLGRKTARGFAWLVAQTLGTRVASAVEQVVLAWLLLPRDFGLVALAYTVTQFIDIIQQAGLRDVLIQRQSHFRYWANPAFWMSVVMGLTASLLMAVAAPIAAHVYKAPLLTPIILILAASPLLNALSVVHTAQLQSELRFGAFAAINLGGVVGLSVLSVLFAWLGFGVSSFVLPVPIMAAVRAVTSWLIVRPPIRRDLQWRRWRYMVANSGLLMMVSVFMVIIRQGDYIALGLWHSQQVVGIYYFAYNLSVQTFMIFTLSLGNVLFPALSQLSGDPPRQTQAFVRAVRLLALITVPGCLLQVALADPLMHLVFQPKWLPTIPVLQILSLGIAFRTTGLTCQSLMKAQGRFKLCFWLYLLYAVLFLILAAAGAYLGAAVAVAVAVAMFSCFMGITNLFVAIRPGGGSWRDVWGVYAVPWLAGAIAIGAAMGLANCLPQMPGRDWARLGIVLVVGTGLYVPLIRRAAPADWKELADHLKGLIKRRAGPSAQVGL